MEEIERCLLVKPEVFFYKIPPRSTARGYRAADWNLTEPDWKGRLRFVVKGKYCEIRLEDKNTGELFAACPVEKYPGPSIEAVTDSSRYFVICVQHDTLKAFVGIGFSDRSDSFDLNVALQDHFKQIGKEEAILTADPEPSLNLALKAGQTFRVNIPIKDSDSTKKNRPKTGSGSGLLPPPGGLKIAPPPGATPVTSPTEDLLGSDDPWGDFVGPGSKSVQSSGNWVQF